MQFDHPDNGLSETVYGPCIFIGKRIIADQLVNRFFYNVNAEHCKSKTRDASAASVHANSYTVSQW